MINAAENRVDPIAGIVVDVYRGEGMFVEDGWSAIAVVVAQELIPGEGFRQFLDRYEPPSHVDPDIVFDVADLERVEAVTFLQETVIALVAPAVLAAAQRAQAEHWTTDELVFAVEKITADYRPRVARLAGLARSKAA